MAEYGSSDVSGAIMSLMSKTTPPPVDSSGGVGTGSRIARDDHTHQSSVWAKPVPTDASGNATFDFPAGFFVDPPVISADLVNSDVTKFYNRAVTTHTKDRVVISVRAFTLLGVISIPAAGLVVNLIARRASS